MKHPWLVLVVVACLLLGCAGPAWQPVAGGEDLTEDPSWACVQGFWAGDGVVTMGAGDDINTGIHHYGPHLEVEGDFGVTARMESASDGMVALSLVGVLPQGAWWEGVKQLDVGFSPQKVSVNIFNGENFLPSVSEHYPVVQGLSGEVTLGVRRVGEEFVILLDGEELGRLADPGVFPEDRVYFGARVMPHDHLTLRELSVEAPRGQGVVVRADEDPAAYTPTDPALADLAAAHDLLIGPAVGARHLRCDPAYAEALGHEFSLLTTENAMKLGPIMPARGEYSFDNADAIVDFAVEHGMQVRGHNLLWHSYNPAWFEETAWTRDELVAFMEQHITTVVGRYRGRVGTWDVVNEALDDSGRLRSDSTWYRVIGPEYLEMAFRFAHAADPDAILVYNDYAAEGVGSKSDGVYALVQDFLERDVPIHGVGLQMHIALGSGPAPENVLFNMDRLADLGMEVHITEIDVRIQGEPTEAQLAAQASTYADMLGVCLQAQRCTQFVFWGFTDRYSWIPSSFQGWGAGLVFDEAYRPKPAYEAMREVLQK